MKFLKMIMIASLVFILLSCSQTIRNSDSVNDQTTPTAPELASVTTTTFLPIVRDPYISKIPGMAFYTKTTGYYPISVSDIGDGSVLLTMRSAQDGSLMIQRIALSDGRVIKNDFQNGSLKLPAIADLSCLPRALIRRSGAVTVASCISRGPKDHSFLIQQYLPDGTRDAAFGIDGVLELPYQPDDLKYQYINMVIAEFALLPNDKLLIHGQSNFRRTLRLIHVDPNGAKGKYVKSCGYPGYGVMASDQIAILKDGSSVFSCSGSNFKINSDGNVVSDFSLDKNFAASNSWYTSDQRDGIIIYDLPMGVRNRSFSRYDFFGNPSYDADFPVPFMYRSDDSTLMSDIKKIIAAGPYIYVLFGGEYSPMQRILRSNVDTSFGKAGQLSLYNTIPGRDAVVGSTHSSNSFLSLGFLGRADGALYVWGVYTQNSGNYKGSSLVSIIKLNAQGKLDTSFQN